MTRISVGVIWSFITALLSLGSDFNGHRGDGEVSRAGSAGESGGYEGLRRTRALVAARA
jgi:hypothetical protein